MKRLLVSLLLAILGGTLVAPAPASVDAASGSVVIRHQLRGCHTWSLDGGRYTSALSARVARGGSLTVMNLDPMVHKLIQQGGPRVGMRMIPHEHMRMVGLHKVTGRGVMSHMGAAVTISFPRPGVYRFRTEDLGEYFELAAKGEDNELTLVVRVP